MKRRLPKILITTALIVGSVIGSAQPAQAQYDLYSRQGKFDIGIGAGINVRSPIHFDLQIAGEYFFTNNFAFGAAFDALIRSPHAFIFTPFARYHFDISRFPKFVPYVGGGIGGGADSNGNGFMDIMLPNLGFKYALTNRIRLGSDMGLHILTDFDDTEVDFRILFVTLNFRF